MVKIIRPKEVPKTLSSDRVTRAKEAIISIVKSRKPLSKEFDNCWGEADVRSAVWEMQHRKCCYCERKREKNRESDIEHFRPKAKVDGAADHKGYWWLAYEWSNLYFSCRYCNQEFKLNKFPLAVESKRAKGPDDNLKDEDPLLLDPGGDEVLESHLGFDWYKTEKNDEWLVSVIQRSEKGENTIKVAGLNQGELLIERGSLVLQLEGLATKLRIFEYMTDRKDRYEKCKNDIKNATRSKQPFAAFRRAYFRKVGLGEYISTD